MTTNTGIHGPEIIKAPKKNIIMDATVLSTLMSCGRLTDFRFNHNFVSAKGKSNSLEAGSIMHKGLEIKYKLEQSGMARNDANAHGYMAARLYADGCPHCATRIEGVDKPACGHQWEEYPGVQNTPEESEGHIIGVKHVLSTYEEYCAFYKGDFWVTLCVETVEGKILYEDDDIRILWKAKLDWKVDNNQGVYPVDHKTAKQRRAKIKLNNQFIGQCLVVGTRAMVVNEIGLQKSLKPQEKFVRNMMPYSADQLLEWQSETLPYWAYKLLDYTETGYWPPNFTHCENKYGNCPFVGVCGSDRNMREMELRVNFIKGPVWDPGNDAPNAD